MNLDHDHRDHHGNHHDLDHYHNNHHDRGGRGGGRKLKPICKWQTCAVENFFSENLVLWVQM